VIHWSPEPGSTSSGDIGRYSYGPKTAYRRYILSRGLNSPIDKLKKTAQFIRALQGATLEQSNMLQVDIDRFVPLIQTLASMLQTITSSRLLGVFLSTTNASRATYDALRSRLLNCYPDDPFLSFGQMKRRVVELSGVVPISHDMCSNTCVGFTGPLADCDQCPVCGKDRYRSGTREPHRQFITIPLGPVVQALYGSLETAEKMHYPANVQWQRSGVCPSAWWEAQGIQRYNLRP